MLLSHAESISTVKAVSDSPPRLPHTVRMPLIS
jgi:hypothetical protein